MSLWQCQKSAILRIRTLKNKGFEGTSLVIEGSTPSKEGPRIMLGATLVCALGLMLSACDMLLRVLVACWHADSPQARANAGQCFWQVNFEGPALEKVKQQRF